MSSVFDPKTFASMTFTDSNSTESVPVPVGEWPATIDKQEIVAWAKKDDPSKSGLKLNLSLAIDDPAVAQLTGRPKNLVRYELMLDLTPEGGLDFGKGMNVRLGRLREALGLNKPGQPFSFDMLVGHALKASIKHEEYKGQLTAQCSGVASLT
jgi:hypothetical protein